MVVMIVTGIKESKEFAGELFGALARKHNISGDSINKTQLKLFWDQISDESFDSRLQTFFDMLVFIYYSINIESLNSILFQ